MFVPSVNVTPPNKRFMLRLLMAWLVIAACGPGNAQSRPGQREKPPLEYVDVNPGTGIGLLRLGVTLVELPPGYKLKPGGAGEFRGLQFLVDADALSEVWIPNLRDFSLPVR